MEITQILDTGIKTVELVMPYSTQEDINEVFKDRNIDF